MSLTLTCTKCGQKLAISEELKGKQVQCPKCREVYLVEKKSSAIRSSAPQPNPNAPAQTPSPATVIPPGVNERQAHPPGPATGSNVEKPSAAPLTASPGSPSSNQASDPSITTCPACQIKMRLPIAPGITDFQCPQCQHTIHITPPEVQVPTAVYSQPSAIDEDPFANLNHAPLPAPPTRPRAEDHPAHISSRVKRETSLAATDPPSMLVPGMLIAIPFGLVTLATLAILAITATKGQSVQDTDAFNKVLIIHGGMLINYVLVFAGGLRMVTGSGKVVTILTCLFALIPTICFGALFYGAFLYPLAVVGSIWGLVSLAMHHNPALKNVRFGKRTPSAESSSSNAADYLRRAEDELKNQPLDAPNDSGLKAMGLLIAGIALLALAAFNMYTMYRYYQGEVEVRRPARGIAGTVFCVITGFGLVARALSTLGR